MDPRRRSRYRILSRRRVVFSRWVSIIEKRVAAGAEGQKVYHSISQSDYVAILARTPEGKFPIVRQYRPAIESATWELPAGLVERGEKPLETCRRELLEETGLRAKKIKPLGAYYADTGRLENRFYPFYVTTAAPDPAFKAERGMEVRFVTLDALKRMARKGEFGLSPHIAVLFLAGL